MNATILHESRGRIRFRLRQKQMTLAQADLLEAWIQGKSWCRQVTVHERTCCVILYYDGTRQAVLNEIRQFFLAGGGADHRAARPQQPGAEPGI